MMATNGGEEIKGVRVLDALKREGVEYFIMPQIKGGAYKEVGLLKKG